MRQLKRLLVSGLMAMPIILPAAGYAEPSFPEHWSDHVVISAVQTASVSSASQEFVELYNPLDQPISLAGWTLEYKSATAADIPASWKAKASLSGVIAAHGYYLVAPHTYLSEADAEWTVTLAGTGGAARLVSQGAVIDGMTYGSTATADVPAAAPAAGGSIVRLPGNGAGNGQDTNISAADFNLKSDAAPRSTKSPTELPEVDGALNQPVAAENPAAGDQIVDPPAPLTITEILPDPASPLTDANDEFIELYNSGERPIQLNGYEIRVGSDGKTRYRLPAMLVAAGSYIALYARDTHISLANSGGMVALHDVLGRQLSVTDLYPEAVEGSSWQLLDGAWMWSTLPTPGFSNVAAVPSVLPGAIKPATPKIARKTAATVRKASVPKAPKVTKVKAKLAAKPTKSAYKPVGFINHQPATWLLIGLGCLTIAYAIYEFRYDAYYYYNKLRGDRTTRSKVRSTTER